MRLILSAVFTLFVFIFAAPPAQGTITNAIVKIYTTYDKPHYARPWLMKGQETRSGSGCVIDGNRILTNAHVVSDHTFIQVRRAGKADKYIAEVEAVSHELDLAVLRVKDEGFFEDVVPFRIGELADVGEKVVAYGFPQGGTRITITEGVVSRIDRKDYSHSNFNNLICQIDAAINPGSSGGPVISNGKIAGVAFQSTSGQNIGYMVPAPLIRYFFKDLEDGHYDGVPGLPFVWQNLENEQMRAYYGMPDGLSGILVSETAPRFMGEDKLLPWDIILSIDGFDVANDGTIEFRKDERINFRYAIDCKQIDDVIPVKVFRKGAVSVQNIALTEKKMKYGYLVPRVRYETPPSYYIIGGLVFTKLTANYLGEWDKWEQVPIQLREYYYRLVSPKNKDCKEVVVLMDVLPDEINVGYTMMEDFVVSTVNEKTINSLEDLVSAFEQNKGEYHRIRMTLYDREIILSKSRLKERDPIILEKYKVPADRSDDLRK